MAIGGYFLLGWMGLERKDWPWNSLSALAAAPPLLLTWYWRTLHKQKDIDTAEQRARIEEQRSEVDAQRLLTERFTRAIELLGSEKLQIRLGGIYALERIAQDSLRDHWTVMETLCAFAREGTREPRLAKREGTPSDEEDKNPRTTFLPPATDIQAALTVMGRRGKERRKWEREKGKKLDLRGAHLERTDLENAHLEGAVLGGAHLAGANLADAHLERAALADAHLEGANLRRAHLANADLWGAHLESANLREARLEHVDLKGAYLERADLWGADLEGADLRNAKCLTQAQIDDAIIDERTKLPKGIMRPTADPAPSAGA